jgi:TolB protein
MNFSINLNFIVCIIFITGCTMKKQFLMDTNQPSSDIGIFETAFDIGDVKHNGASVYDPETDKYTLQGSGRNMWFDMDEFHFLWKHVRGHFILDTRLEWTGDGIDPHRKAGLIIRENLEPSSRYVSAAFHGDGLISMQYRLGPDSLTQEFQAAEKFLSVLQLEKSGNKIVMRAARPGASLQRIGEIDLDFEQEELFAGLFVCAHNPDVIEEAIFKNTRLTFPIRADFTPYKDYIGSKLEILDVESGLRKVIYQSDQPCEAPNWSKDGKYLVFNSKGLLYRISVNGGIPQQISSGFAQANNNDHGFSPDGSLLAISHHANDRPEGENSVIYLLPSAGGTPKQVTDKSPSYWHGWSPDGNYLIYTARRKNQWDIYKISTNGGEEIQLTDNQFLDDGSEYSPDGKYICFNSNRSGSMEIWRMKPDGSKQMQVTDDNYQNWFPHPSPDGKWIVFLSYPPEVDAWDHPYYKRIMLRLLSPSDNKSKVIAYLYGGQGTINVPSWSPDSKRLAFFSNSDCIK